MAGFTFHIPYLIRMFTLLLSRWHTSGGFLIIFDNFTVTPSTPEYEKVGYKLASDLLLPIVATNETQVKLTSLDVELIAIHENNPAEKYEYKVTYNVDFGNIDKSQYSAFLFTFSWADDSFKGFIEFEPYYRDHCMFEKQNISDTPFTQTYYSSKPLQKITNVNDYFAVKLYTQN